MASRVRHRSLHQDKTKRTQDVPGQERQDTSLPQPDSLGQRLFKPIQYSGYKSH